MRVFVTGATGFIGSEVVKDLIGAGHHVLGLCRSKEKAPALAALGAEVHQGDLTDLESLRQGAAAADGVIHLAFIHDFSKFAENAEIDRRAIEAIGSVLKGSNRPLLVTSGLGLLATGRIATETDKPSPDFPRVSEAAAWASGCNAGAVRLPQVHDTAKQGFITYLTGVYRQQSQCAYIGDGENRWPAVPVQDAAHLYRLALEKAEPNAIYHAVAEEGVTLRAIAETIGLRLNLPVNAIPASEAQAFFGWLAPFAGLDMPASSTQTREKLGWQPTGRGLLDDLRELQI
ncbi:SDR family oxidoreductase [Acidocella aminolytica]|jgi:nucleoside-diphosphate-sugar epimerase|uniref:NAD dependent epimerase/dehydratase n=1 Tax=Acidocella aminolytica 101 = DSM 11237 TaxID=1120923 RepID=A0A0D6PI61_9PROT|nr:SDR family oxidoreductase [Acidocella aminolytica]GAN81342.1 NAD dependent epimerase/dehydratase [Acidocella aminolytica 101 = DSM 11237]GBQ42038.1 nucleoside-diphosphate-sugar epimerase [Acidocella aminolytica 101 = DSM 11237]SHF50145.1 Nucleoside-diphosphate-sugar epimerase [Acidocella aminolytica 101 = DSM 11237]